MRRSIRQQILVPLVVIQTVTLAAITAAGVGLAARRSEQQSVDRLGAVIDVLGRSSFPLTSRVLAQMHGLSGAHFVVKDAEGRTTAASDPEVGDQPVDAASISVLGRPEFRSWRDWPKLSVAGRTYFGAAIPAPASGGAGASTLLVLYPESSWRDALWDFALAPVVLGIVALALMVLASRWFADRISRRVHRLRAQVARIAEGEFSELELGAGHDEIQDLTRSVNQMSAQLRDMRLTIVRSERTHLLAQLAAGFAHQLRNTLTGARLGIQLHLKRCPAAGGDSSLGVALRQLTLTEEQVQGLLTLGRLERRPPRACDLGELIRDLESLLEPTFQHARVALESYVPHEPVTAEIDEPSVRAAILNLAWNAIDAAGPGGRVQFHLIDGGEQTIIEVADSGQGPPADLEPALFDPFVTGKPEGVGLGLALARHVAEAHRGELDWSRRDGWTWFRLTLPRTPDLDGKGISE
ncbi:MAG: HAMP domain-containing sensor histidine kinase [Paludisphaera borealis]|uniref:sensor histidine kinase n=1 Tax=Paludisphaera borealis TaxID=1387353 RepID=UPI00284ABCFE|nr:HAMP domain-containing sensor histidine kinase [Paludisphaera borealis]MDR3622387.1 HAMP domain-containing sensor histidine kinase [Paludisphaera borealis]